MTFWNSQTLKQRIPAQRIIEPFDEKCVKHAAYEMAVGSEAFITSNPSEKTQLSPGTKVVIPPGQFGLLTTRERLRIPSDVIAFISIRASVKFRGLVNVSGFHVDPGYAGPLKFAVYNAGSQPILLDQGQPVFMIWFSSLAEPDAYPYPPKDARSLVITAADVEKIQGEIASPAALKKQFDELKHDVEKRIHVLQTGLGILTAIVMMLLKGCPDRPAVTHSGAAQQPSTPAAAAASAAPQQSGPPGRDSLGSQRPTAR